MSENSVKTYLQSIRSARMEIDYLSDKVEELRTSLLPSGIRYDKINVQTSPDGDQMTDIFCKIENYEGKIKELLQVLLDDYNGAAEMIMTLEKSEHRQVLWIYYLDKDRPKWPEVARRMQYSEQRIYQLHNDAITILERAAREKLNQNKD